MFIFRSCSELCSRPSTGLLVATVSVAFTLSSHFDFVPFSGIFSNIKLFNGFFHVIMNCG